MSNNVTVEIEIPFFGFYESIHQDNINTALEQHYQDDEGNVDSETVDAVYSAGVDWREIFNEYSRRFTDKLAQRTELDLEYIEVISPREYNFQTDRIFAKIPKTQLNKIRKEVEAYPEWAETIKEKFTSYSGFSSNYSSDIKDEDWTRELLDECQYRVILELYFDRHLDDDWELWTGEDVLAYEMDSIGKAISVIDKYIEDREKES